MTACVLPASIPARCGRLRALRVTGSQPVSAGRTRWGGWGSNPRPADYESAARQFAEARHSSDLGI